MFVIILFGFVGFGVGGLVCVGEMVIAITVCE